MKQIYSALALVAFSAVLAGCAMTETEAPKAAAPAAAAPAAAPSAALSAAVTTALGKEAQLAGTKITAAATTDGAVTLTGNVKNEWQQYLAGDIAKKTAGIKSVKNSIKVD